MCSVALVRMSWWMAVVYVCGRGKSYHQTGSQRVIQRLGFLY
jgi:hypothetical protein